MSPLFGTDGIRGRVGVDLTVDLARDVGRAMARAAVAGALGRAVRHPRIVVGRDTRTSGEALEAALVEGLAEGGADALLCGILPTPGVAFVVGDLGADGGVVISASHNPPQDNGLKILGAGGWKLDETAESAIEADIGVGSAADVRGRADAVPGAAERYLEHLVPVPSERLTGLRVIADCAYGAAWWIAPHALRRAGAEVVELNAEPDGARINDGCGATHPKVVAEAAAAAGAIGVCFDGDADRVLFADETGEVVDGDAMLAILAADLGVDRVVTTVMANQSLRAWCDTHRVGIVETPVGDRHVLRAMRDRGLPLGGEQSGHVIRLERATTGDGTLTALGVLEAVAKADGRLESIVPFRPMPQVLVNVPTARREGLADSDTVAAAVDAARASLGDQGRVLVRPSGTEPLVRVMVEAPSEAVARRLAEDVAAAMRGAEGSG